MAYGVKAIAPGLDKYTFTVDGYLVPNIEGVLIDGENTWNLVLDGRLAIVVPNEELEHWLWFVANAMAVAAGYSSFGEHCQPINPFQRRLFQIGTVDTETTD